MPQSQANDKLSHASDGVQRSQSHPGFHHPVYWLYSVCEMSDCVCSSGGDVGGVETLKQTGGKKSMHFGNTVGSCALFSVHAKLQTHTHTQTEEHDADLC